MGVFSWEQYKKGVRFKRQRQDRHRKQLVNHLEFNSCLVTKKVRHVAVLRAELPAVTTRRTHEHALTTSRA